MKDYEGQDVLQSALRVTNTGDGLSQSMIVDPIEYHVDQEVTLIVKGKVSRVQYDPIKDTEALRRVHTVTAGFMMVIDEQLVHGPMEAHRQRLDERKGVQRLDLGGGEGGDGDDD